MVIKEVAQCHTHPRAVFPSQGQSRAAGRWLGHLGLARAALPLSSSPSVPPPPPGISRAVYPTSSHHAAATALLLHPPHQFPSWPQLRASSPASRASQQLPDNASTDNRLSCCLQVCQPWACQINVTVNSQGGRGGSVDEVKVVRDGVWMEQGGARPVDGAEWKRSGSQWHTCDIYITVTLSSPAASLSHQSPLSQPFSSSFSQVIPFSHISPTHLSPCFFGGDTHVLSPSPVVSKR